MNGGTAEGTSQFTYDGSAAKEIDITPAAIGTITQKQFNDLVAEVDKKAPKASPEFTGTPTAPTPATSVNDKQIATTAFVHNLLKANDAMMFKGVIHNDSKLLEEHEVGWTYKVGTAGTYAGQKCEAGDMIICVTDGATANNNDWSVIQNNIDGAVISGITSSSPSPNGNIVIFGDDSGKVVTSSGTSLVSLTTSVESKLSNETAITAGTGISVTNGGKLKDGVTITNAGVRSIATGSKDGTISVNTNGTSADVAITGLKSAAYKEATYFATADSVTGLSNTVNSLSTSKQDKLVTSNDITIGTDNKLTIAVISDDFINGLQ